MNIEQARFNMVEQQIRTWDVLDQDVLDLLFLVRREEFVPPACRSLAFMDTEIPLPGGECMFTPKLEARIVQELNIKKHETVLEIGTGSGYLAALLAYRARQVTTIEISNELVTFAKKNLDAYGITNVDVIPGNGFALDIEENMFDAIVVSGGLPVLPEHLPRQLKIGGRMIVFIGEAPLMAAQLITRLSDHAFDTQTLFETVVRPLRDAVHVSHFTF